MRVFISNDEFSSLQNEWLAASHEERLPLLLELAWHTRQRDSVQALQLVEQAAQLAHAMPHTLPEVSGWLNLIRGETRYLGGDLAGGRSLLNEALTQLREKDQTHACSDACRLLAQIALDDGDDSSAASLFLQAIAYAEAAHDVSRKKIAQSAIAILQALQDPEQAMLEWGREFDPKREKAPESANIHQFFGYCLGLRSDLAAAIGHWVSAHEMAIDQGQIRLAISAATNIGVAFNSLNEHHAALEWTESALELARRNRWPGMIALALLQTADTLRQQDQLDAAGQFLQEAETFLANSPSSRNYALTIIYQGELAQDYGNFENAHQFFLQGRELSRRLGHSDLEMVTERGLAQAQLALGQPEEALNAALRALELTRIRQDCFNEIDVLKVLAKIHSTHSLPGPQLVAAENVSLYYLEQAQKLAESIDGYLMGNTLSAALSHEYAKRGQYLRAYQIMHKANLDRDKAHRQEVTNRAVAMRVQHQTASAVAESEHHRRLALSEAKRAAILQQTGDTLERLCEIGGEITSKLDLPVVFEALARHVQELLSPGSFLVFLKDADGQHLNLAFGIEHGQHLPPARLELRDTRNYSVNCLLQRQELVIDLDPADPMHVEGTLRCLSALYVPLAVGERVFGVASVQSARRYAFGEREQLVFRTLCAYGAIALDNAHAYRQLHDARTHLVSQEKLAALGSLVAGVAHELNTPLGNCLMITSALQATNHAMLSKMDAPGMRRADLDTYLDEHAEATAVIMRGLSSATELVNSFKQVAMDRTNVQRRIFNLLQTTRDEIATLGNQIKHSGHQISIDIPDDIEMTSHPGPYGQVITNLVNNALLHAFDDGRSGGQIRISATRKGDEQVEIRFADDGVGIPAEHIKRIFDPFFTTKMGQGGSGLGMSISYKLVTSILHGQIRVESTPGQGTCFIIDLPLLAEE